VRLIANVLKYNYNKSLFCFAEIAYGRVSRKIVINILTIPFLQYEKITSPLLLREECNAITIILCR